MKVDDDEDAFEPGRTISLGERLLCDCDCGCGCTGGQFFWKVELGVTAGASVHRGT